MPKFVAKLILLPIIIILIGSSCAKRNTEWKTTSVLTELAEIPLMGNPLDIDSGDGVLFVAEDQGGLAQINMSNYSLSQYITLPSDDGSTTKLSNIRKVSYVPSRKRLFILETNEADKIQIINATNLDSLKVITPIAGGTNGIRDMKFIDIVNATDQFTIAGAWVNVDGSSRQACYGKYDGVNDIWFGVTDPFPIVLPVSPSGFALTDTHIFIAAEQRGLLVYSRATGSMVGSIDLPGEAMKVCVKDNYAYLACRQAGLQVVNIADLSAMTLVGGFDTTGYATTIDVKDNRAVVSSGGGGVYLFDITSPSDIQLIENMTACGYTNQAKFYQDKLVVAGRDKGIIIYAIE